MVDKTLRTVGDLAAAGLVHEGEIAGLQRVADRYAVALTPALVELIDAGDPRDPIARQFLPDARELIMSPSEQSDPIGDGAHSPVPGIVHRYPDRVLLKLTGVCAVYCRFCFRREMVGPGQEATLSPAALQGALAYIRSHPKIWEVIVTGGDPLVLSPRRLREVTAALAEVPHVKVLRWHTRVPVAAPESMTRDLVSALKTEKQTAWLAVHINHPRELTPAARDALGRLADAGIPLLSQTVLLRGINDDPDTLEALLRALVECRVKPYYLHHADLAPGTSHWRTTIAEGRQLISVLRGRVSGLCQPAYVLDIPGGHGKVPIAPEELCEKRDEGRYRLTDFCGCEHDYVDTAAPAVEAPGQSNKDRLSR